ncbi:unnamed protein product, partial [Staurois parvus]
NPNTCKLIGLRESYSVYKWRCSILECIFFNTNNGAISDLWQDCGGHSGTGGELTSGL